MNVIRGGKSKKPAKRVKPPVEAEEASLDDIKDAKPKVKAPQAPIEVPNKIEVPRGFVNHIVPAHVFRCGTFKFAPATFVTESEQLNETFMEADKQTKSLSMFLKDPSLPMIYGVAGNPDDIKAKYFAAFLVYVHARTLGANANVVWHTMYGGFDNKLVNDNPTMLVLTNLTPTSTGLKLEKARDLVEKYPDIPRVIVNAGLDPVSFLTTRMYLPTNGFAYFSQSIVKKRLEVI